VLNALLPRSHRGRVLAAGALLDAVATGVYLAVATLYFVDYVGIAATSVGVALSVANLFGLLVPMPVARLTRTLGTTRVYVALLVLRGVGMAAYVFADGYWRYLVVTCFFTAVSRAALPLLQVLVGQLEGEDDRTHTMASMRTVNNIGMSLGFLAASVVQLTHSRAAYLGLFAGAGVAFGVVAVVTVAASRGVEQQAVPPPERTRRPRTVYTDVRFLAVAVANAVLLLHDSMLFILIPLWVVQRSGLSPTVSSILLLLNTAITVLLQVHVSKYAKGPNGALRMLRWSIVALALASVVLGSADGGTPWVLVALIALAVVLLTVGENLHAVAGWELSFLMANPAARPQYLSLFSLSYTGQLIIGPVLMTAVVLPWGMPGLLLMTGLFVIAAVVTQIAVRGHTFEREARQPARAEVRGSRDGQRQLAGGFAMLKTEGFADLVREVADTAGRAPAADKAVRIALTLGDRVAEEDGLSHLTSADRVVVDHLRDSDIHLDPGVDTGDWLFLTRTGRLLVRLDDLPAPAAAHPLGALRWSGDGVAAVKARWHERRRESARDLESVRRELAAEPVAAVHERLDRIQHTVLHMAPILIYVEDEVFSNLGKTSNLPGKSLAADSPRSRLNQLRRLPVGEWSPEDACFVACLHALLLSGPPVRAEEFNGAQLTPTALADFLAQRTAGYGAAAPIVRTPPHLADLAGLAMACATARTRAIVDGVTPYRVINGLNLRKHERLMATPARLGDAPEPVVAHVSGLLGAAPGLDTPIVELAPLFADLAARTVAAPPPERFGTAFEAVLHGFLSAVTEAFDADVAMSRGPQDFAPLRAEPAPDADPLSLRTGDFYCCVVPRAEFVHRFGADRAGLARTLAAYSARMRFNTWHYLPHTLGIVEREPGREDWFFAPAMPDVTEWSDQHHTGHVTFGVRYAIRLPFGIDYDGRALPGLYDLRLMRAWSPPFTVDELRRAIAAAALLRQLYQAMSPHRPRVTDFGRDWYQGFHG